MSGRSLLSAPTFGDKDMSRMGAHKEGTSKCKAEQRSGGGFHTKRERPVHTGSGVTKGMQVELHGAASPWWLLCDMDSRDAGPPLGVCRVSGQAHADAHGCRAHTEGVWVMSQQHGAFCSRCKHRPPTSQRLRKSPPLKVQNGQAWHVLRVCGETGKKSKATVSKS